MNFNRLSEYLEGMERRLRALALTRGAAITAAAALCCTVAGVLIANYLGFSPAGILWGRLLLFFGLVVALSAGLALPLLRLNRRKAAHEIEQRCPRFEQRLVTFAEKAGESNAFMELLAADTLEIAREAAPDQIASKNRLLSYSSAAAACLIALAWLGSSGSGFLGYGTSLLWGAIPNNELRPFYAIQLQPGNATIRRKSDQVVTARLMGFQTERVRMLAKFDSSSKWEEAPMRPQPEGPIFEFLFAGVPESLSYYVEAGGVRSKQYRIEVMDLPEVKHVRVTYHYPAWTSLKDKVEDPGGDLRAVEGTEADVRVETDRPLDHGALVLDDGTKIELRDSSARVPIQKDGLYHVAVAERGEMVRLSNDYFIEAQKAVPPAVHIRRPGHDAKVNPIEEVTIDVEAQDDFGLRGIDLHYSVNGGTEKTVSLGGAAGKNAHAATTLYLEDYKLVPGDIVSFYGTARNGLAAAKTDIFFIEVQPFEREFSQSQQAGGAGGADGDNPTSERQKEIIAATWNQLKSGSKDKGAEAENAKLLAFAEGKLRDQAKSLAQRMQRRELAAAHATFQKFVEEMGQAVQALDEAAQKLGARAWQAALPPEQKALQHLERAEATFRQIQVAFGNQGGGGGGSRDIQGLIDLELDREKNQYETGRQNVSKEQRQKEIEEALQKLEELARRQQELAEQQRNSQQAYQQRWQQEMLRREAEELRRKMEQLSRNQQAQAPQGQQGERGQSGQQGQQSSQGGQQGQQGQQSSQGGSSGSSALDRSLEQLARALRDMQNAGSPLGAGSPHSEAEARRAAERLREAHDSLSGARKQEAGAELESLQRNSQQMAEAQQNLTNHMRRVFGAGNPNDPAGQLRQGGPKDTQQLMAEQKKLLDDLNKLEQEMQKAVRDLAGNQQSAAGKLRDALGEMQSQELRLKMGWSLEVMRRGMGPYAMTRQAPVTEGLNKLRDRVREAQQAFHNGQSGDSNLEAALAQTEQLRRRLEQMRNSAGQKPGQQGQPGEHGKPGGQQQDERDGQSQQPGNGSNPAGQSGQQSESASGSPESGGAQGSAPHGQQQGSAQMAHGSRFSPGTGAISGVDSEMAGRAVRDGLRDLSRLEQMLRGNREMSRNIRDLMGEMREFEARRGGITPARLDEMITRLIGGIEQVELQLRRTIESKDPGSVRSGASQTVPPGYVDAVAEYFRRLSQQK
ncbi:MAG: hypothetical protein DMG57_15580 [Acidobacteria bacterium]|nr:MAG: hypothetical protein DMG57_15580 [Acidobacteriota bacterium]